MKRGMNVKDRELRSNLEAWMKSSQYGLWARSGSEAPWRRWRRGESIEGVGITSPGMDPELQDEHGDGTKRILFKYEEPLCREALLLYPKELDLQVDWQDRLHWIIREWWLEELVIERSREDELWLRSLRELTSSLDLNELLLRIMHSALKVIPSADCGFFMMFNSESGKLVPRASVGVGESIYAFRVHPGEGITGKIFNSGKGEIFLSPPSFIKAMDNVAMDNMASLSQAFEDSPEKVNAVMAVPVTMNTDKIGVMLVHQTKKYKQMEERDLHRLQGFADQAAIAIANARLFSELEEKNRYLTKRNEIHDIFTKLSVEGNDLGMFTQTMSRMIGLSVLFVDLVKDEWYPRSESSQDFSGERLRKLFNSIATYQTLESQDERKHCLYPIWNRSMLLGCFVVELGRPLERLDYVVLEQGSAVVALEMMNTHSLTEMYYRGNQELFNEIVLHQEPRQLEMKLKRFGLSNHAPLFVCILQLTEENSDSKRQDSEFRRLISGIEKEVGRTNLLLFSAQDKITLLASAADEQIQDRFVQKLRSVVDNWSSLQTSLLFGGVGGLYIGLANVSKSNDEANRSLAYLIRRERPGIIRYGDIGINRLFINQDPDEIETYVRDVLAPLRSQRGQSGELERTLKTYMAANRAAGLTAEKLHIHPNTLYHRLRKIEELLGLNLDEPDEWLKIYLACHLSDT